MIKYLIPYGWSGIIIMLIAEVLLFTGNQLIGIWITPIMWTGYILFADNVVYVRTGKSLITNGFFEIIVISLISIGSWLIFEGYNVFLKNWHYINLPENIYLRYFGYAWSFATITPGILITAGLIRSFNLFKSVRLKPVSVSHRILGVIVAISFILSLYPLIFPNEYLFPLVWCSMIFLVDPINYLIGGKSLLRDLSEGNPSRFLQLLVSGLICGIMWEFWNYWASAKWIYTVPYFPEYKIFEMPIVGYFGFPPFAIECYVLYHFFKAILYRAGYELKYA